MKEAVETLITAMDWHILFESTLPHPSLPVLKSQGITCHSCSVKNAILNVLGNAVLEYDTDGYRMITLLFDHQGFCLMAQGIKNSMN